MTQFNLVTGYRRLIWVLCIAVYCLPGFTALYTLPPQDTDLIGSLTVVHTRKEDTLLDVAKLHNIGQKEITISNPGVDRWIPGDRTKIVLPTRYILPDVKRQGIVLNIPEMRMYYFSRLDHQPHSVETFPVSIGRMDWQTPLGKARIIEKTLNPSWRPPESIKQEHAADGDPLPDVVPSGPDNPLGNYAMRLNLPGYLIHSTNKPLGIGMRVTHGCVRMYPSDIETLFPKVNIGTQVQLVNHPVKVGWFADTLYIEVHPPLEEEDVDSSWLQTQAEMLIDEKIAELTVTLDTEQLKTAISEKTGVPVAIGVALED
ncbi:MAG: L,D-transpeptidase family protein [Gammaproteobacteria bacterium]|nr:L,D-transpeptidase family protein [Gammaproteobacteria bacterium]